MAMPFGDALFGGVPEGWRRHPVPGAWQAIVKAKWGDSWLRHYEDCAQTMHALWKSDVGKQVISRANTDHHIQTMLKNTPSWITSGKYTGAPFRHEQVQC